MADLKEAKALLRGVEICENGSHHAMTTIRRHTCTWSISFSTLSLAGPCDARDTLRAATEIGRRQGAKWTELRRRSFAQLLRETERRDEAPVMLAEIYGWFTEGFDTPT